MGVAIIADWHYGVWAMGKKKTSQE